MNKRINLFVLAIILVFSLTGCKKEEDKEKKNDTTEEEIIISTESQERVDMRNYTKVKSLSDVSFYIRNEDIREDIVFNPSILNETTSPFYYWLGGYTDQNTGDVVPYQPVVCNTEGKNVCFHTEREYRYFSEDFDYLAYSNQVLTMSLKNVTSADDFCQSLNYIDFFRDYQKFENITCENPEGFTRETGENNYYKCSMPIKYTNMYGHTYEGVVVMLESNKGQCLLICGGKDFDEDDRTNIVNGFCLDDNITNITNNYYNSELTIDIGGKAMTGYYSDIFAIDPSNPIWYISSRLGYSELFSANNYANVGTLNTIYYAPRETTSLEFLTCYSRITYAEHNILNITTLTDADGRTWERYDYQTCEIPNLDLSSMYVCVEGRYVYLIGLYYSDDTRIDYVSMMDKTIESIHITDGMSIPYVDSTELFYLCYGMEKPQEEIASPTDAQPTVDGGMGEEEVATTEAPTDVIIENPEATTEAPPVEQTTEQQNGSSSSNVPKPPATTEALP